MSPRPKRVPAWDCKNMIGPGYCCVSGKICGSSKELCLFYASPDTEQGVTADPPLEAPRAVTSPDQPVPASDHHP